MMLIVLINLVIVLILLLGFVLFLNGRDKKRKKTEMERLLTEIEANETTRQKQIVNILTTQIGMSEQVVLEKVENFVAAEKQLTHKFLEILMDQQPVTNFYQYSSDCLDEYMRLIGENLNMSATEDKPVEKQSISESQNDPSSEQTINLEDNQTEISDSEPEEINDTKNDTAPAIDNDSTAKAEKNEAEEDEFSEEPDWGDAFAEAGVEMEDKGKRE